jgi:hypothetical protein
MASGLFSVLARKWQLLFPMAVAVSGVFFSFSRLTAYLNS